ncbi:MAG: carboxylating nicotinate-nucleotide diphosphorylase [Leptonema sp. (in: Bacteria)]|nr:carboxylating nicotinate-nucleotide diphosphorylase [Leptonema sp. (in: bacteria)]
MNDYRPHYTKPVSVLEKSQVDTLIRLSLSEDAPFGDVTSESIFDKNVTAFASVVARESGFYCGQSISRHLIEIFSETTSYDLFVVQNINDGSHFEAGDTLLKLKGSLRGILRIERPLLNFLQYLSAITTTTALIVKQAGPDIAVLDTRKTLPGYRYAVKYAVYCGGGTNHRIHLSDMAMIKDNHIAAAGSITMAAQRVKKQNPTVPIDIEIDRLDQLDEALSCQPKVILLDNMTSEQVNLAVSKIQQLPESDRPFIELSGKFTPDRFHELAGLHGIGVSMGYLTHTTRFLDLGMEIES